MREALLRVRVAAAMLIAVSAVAGVAPARADLALLTPNGGEQWEVGTVRPILWTGAVGGSARIELSRDGGATWEMLHAAVPNDGTETWTVSGAPSPDCLLRVTPLDAPETATTSASVFAVVGALPGVVVSAPADGERWVVGTARAIAWSAPGAGDVRIELSRDGGASFEVLFEATANDGAETWTVTGPAAASGVVRVTPLDDPAGGDDSGGFFAIEPSPGIVLLTPNGGEIWEVGLEREIRWVGGSGGTVRLELSRDLGGTFEVLVAETPDDGVEPWTVTGPTSADCLLRVTPVDGAPGGASAQAFAIVDASPRMTVTAPNGGEIWVVGSQQVISWSDSGGGDVRIEIERAPGAGFETLFARTPNDGSEVWTVTVPISSYCIVRITRLDDPTASDASNLPFLVIAASGLRVMVPRGGDVWPLGSRQTVRWQGLSGGRVRIELSRDGGATWETIAPNTLDDGIEPWVVSGAEATNCFVRVTRLSPPLFSDVSDAPFTITPRSMTVTAPRPDDAWPIGTQQRIRWSALGALVQVELSRDGGGSWEVLTPSTPNDGEQFWAVTGPPTTTALVRVTSLDDESVFDVTPAPFAIVRGEITVTSPNGHEQWAIGSAQPITWSRTNGGTVRIELSRDGGAWETIRGNEPNDGSAVWTVTGPACAACRLRITSWLDAGVTDEGDAPFAVFCRPTTSTILPGEEQHGDIAASDCPAAHRAGTRADRFLFTMPGPDLVTVAVTGDGFAPYAVLVGPDGSVVAEGTGPGDEAAVLDSLDLPAGGPYAIEVTTAAPGAVGAYRVSLARFDVTLLAPGGGEVWRFGERRIVAWRSAARAVPVDVILYRNGQPGVGGEALFVGTPNDGNEPWIVTGPAASDAVVEVCIPYGNRGTKRCATSPRLLLRPCTAGDTRPCYSGRSGTLGVGPCRGGTQLCAGTGVFGSCTGEVVPAQELCGDGLDQNCDGRDLACVPCPTTGECSTDDPCTVAGCVAGECREERPAGWALVDCRHEKVRETLRAVEGSCRDAEALAVKQLRRRLGRLATAVEASVARARRTANRRRCVARVAAARRGAMRLRARVAAAAGRHLVCEPTAGALDRRLEELAASIIAASACQP
jgi:hypothetical protein